MKKFSIPVFFKTFFGFIPFSEKSMKVFSYSIILLAFLFANSLHAQVISEGFEESSWNSTLATNASATIGGATAPSNATVAVPNNSTWTYSAVGIGTATSNYKNGTKGMVVQSTSSSFICTPFFSGGVSQVTMWVYPTSATTKLLVGVATAATTASAQLTSSFSNANSTLTNNSSVSGIWSMSMYTQGLQMVSNQWNQITFTTNIPASQSAYVKVQRCASGSVWIDDIVITAPVTCTTPTKTFGVTATSTSVCSGGTTTIGLDGAQVGVTYQLYKNGVPLGGNDSVVAASTAAFTFPAVTPANGDRYAVWTKASNGYCAVRLDGAAVADTAKTITVSPTTVGGTATYNGGAVCSGSNPSGTFTLAGHTGSVVKWQKSTSSDFTSDVTDIANTSTTLTAAEVGAVTAQTYVRAVVQSGTCSAANSAVSGSVTITPAPSISAESLSGDTYTQGATASALSVTASNATFFRWFKSADAIVDTTGDVFVGSSSTYTPSTVTVGTSYYYCAVLGCSPSAFSNVSGAIVVNAPASPTIVKDATGFNGSFGNQAVNTSSSARSFVISGSALTADLVVTAPSGFEVSLSSGSGFTSSLSLSPSSGSVGLTTIYVRFSPTATGVASGNVTASSTGATSQDIAVDGTGVSPTITLGTSSLNFSVNGWTASTSQSTSISGSNLLGDITVTVSAPFQVSTNNSTWNTTATYTQTSGSASGTLYVRYNPSSGTGDDAVTLTTSSTSANNPSISLTGKAAPVITLTSAVGTNAQLVKAGVAITTISYSVAGGVSSASASGLPSGVSLSGTSSITINGTLGTETSYPQTYTYTVTVNGPTGTSPATATGTIVVKDPAAKKIAYIVNTGTSANDTRIRPYLNERYDLTNINLSTITAGYDFSAYDLVVLTESPASGATMANLEDITKPFLNLKAFSYGSTTFNWGAGVNTNDSVLTVSKTSHPIFSGLTLNGTGSNELKILSASIAALGTNKVQGATLATMTTKGDTVAVIKSSTASVAIHELKVGTNYEGVKTRAAKYMMIGMSDNSIKSVTDDGLKLIANAARYLTNYVITATAGSNGSISPSGFTYLSSGGSQTYTITPNSGYVVSDVLVNGVSQGAITTYTFTSVTADHTISATFIPTPCDLPVIGDHPSTTPQSLCLNATATTLAVDAGGTGTVSYQWYSNTTNSNTGGTLLSGATDATYTPLTTATGTLYYYCVVTNDCGDGTSSLASNVSGAVTVSGAVGGTASGAQTICYGSQPSSDLTVNGITGTVTKWQYSSDNFASDVHDIANASATLTGATIGALTANTYFRAVVENCSQTANSSSVLVTVNATSVAGTVSSSQSICGGDVPSSLSLNGYTGTSIQWQSSTTGATIGFANIPSATAATYAPAALSQTTYYRAVVSNGVCVADTTSAVTITVNTSQSITLSSAVGTNAQTVCINTAITDITYSTGGPVTGASITSGSLPAGVTLNYSAGTVTISGTPTESGSFSYTITTSGSCNAATASGTITVNAAPVAGTVSSSQSICSGVVPTALTLNGSTGSIQWQSSITSASSGFTNIGSATSASFAPAALTQTTYYRAIVSSGVCADATTNAVTITVTAAPSVATGATGDTRCGSGTVNLSVDDPGAGNVIDWYAAASGGTSVFTGTTYSPSISSTTTFYAEVRNSASGCVATSRLAVTGTVNTPPSISAQPSPSGANFTLNGTATAITVTASGSGTLTYAWYKSTDASNATAGDDVPVGTNSNSYTPSTTSVGTTYYYCIVTGCSAVTSDVTGAIVVAASSAKDITAFTFASQVSSTIGSNTVTVVMPAGTLRYSLAPSAITVSANASVSPAAGVAQDFRSPVVYTVTAQDGTTKQYTVTVTNQAYTCNTVSLRFPSGFASAASYTFSPSNDIVYATDGSLGSSTSNICGGAARRTQESSVKLKLVSTSASAFSIPATSSGSSARTIYQISVADTENGTYTVLDSVTRVGTNISSTVTGSTCGVISVSGLNIPVGKFVKFDFCTSSSSTGLVNVNVSGFDITPVCTSYTQLTTPTVGTASSITNQGFTANWNDISNEIGYRVIVYSGVDSLTSVTVGAGVTSAAFTGLSSNTTYTFKVRALGDNDVYTNSNLSLASSNVRTLSTAKDITSFVIAGITADITGTDITATVPNSTNLTSQTPTVSVSANASYSPSGAQDFTNPVAYTVTAEDGSTKVYTATITKSTVSSACDLTVFTIAGQFSSSISGTDVSVVMPYGTDLSSLTPSLTVSPAATYSPSGATDFSGGVVTYTITAEDGVTTKDYFVTVTIATPSITACSSALSFSVTGWTASTAQNCATISGSNLASDIQVSVDAPFQLSLNGTSGWATTATIAKSGNSVSGATIYVRYNPSSGTGLDNGTVTFTSNGAVTQSFSVTGKAAPSITLTSAAATTSQSVKAGVAITNITYTVTGGISSASASGLPSGVTLNGTSSISISGTPATESSYPQTYSYTVTVNGPAGTTAATATGSIIVKDPNAKKVAFLYTSTTPPTGSNKLYTGLAPYYDITVITASNTAGDTAAIMADLKNNYDLTILHEAVTSSNLTALQLGKYIGLMPILNTKSHMYGKTNWPAGSGNNADGTYRSVRINPGYTSHPIFNGVTVVGDSAVIAGSTGIVRFASGLTMTTSRGVARNSANASGTYSILEDSVLLTGKKKYMLVALSASNEDLTANGLKLMRNVCDHLMAQSIFASANEGGLISPNGEKNLATGSNQTYTITPNSGYLLTDVKVDGVSQGAITTYTFNNVTVAHKIEATFTACSGYTWTGAVDNDFNNSGNWQCGVVPPTGTGADVSVSAGETLPLSSSVTLGDITLGAGSSINLQGFHLTLSGSVNGTLLLSGSTNSSLTFSGSGNPTVNFTSGTGSLSQLNVLSDMVLGSTLAVYTKVTVGSGATLTTNDLLTLKSSITSTAYVGQSAGTITGNVGVERYIRQNTSRGWRMLAVPIQSSQSIKASWQEGATSYVDNPRPGYGTRITANTATAVADGYDAQTFGNSLLSYNAGPTPTWSGVTSNLSTTNIATTGGWMIYIRGDRTVDTAQTITAPSATILETKGTLYQGDQTVNTVNGFNIVGNLYASEVDFTQLSLNGVTNSFYLWDPKLSGSYGLGGFQTFSSPDWLPTPGGGSYGSAANTKIQSGLAFLVYSNGAGSVGFSESAKTTGSNGSATGFRPSLADSYLSTNLYAVTSGTPSLADGNRVFFDVSFSNDLDSYDNEKAAGFGEGIGMLRSSKVLQTERRQPVVDGDYIAYNLSGLKSTTGTFKYRLEFAPVTMNTGTIKAFLEDAYLKTSKAIDLSTTNSVDFTVVSSNAATYANRFKLVFRETGTVPVRFTSVKATQVSQSVKVEWSVSNEQGISRYEVERSSNGSTFTKLGTTGSTSSVNYSYMDNSPLMGVNYYRVRSIGENGSSSYTYIVKVVNGKVVSSITITGNVIKGGMVGLQFNNQIKGDYVVKVLNTVGQELHKSRISHTGGNAGYSVTIPGVVKGLYHVDVQTPDNEHKVFKVVVE